MKLIRILALFAVLWSSVASAAVVDAVVNVGGCSGVCVDQCGLVLTARHCDLPETVEVVFPDRVVPAVRVYLCNDTEGVVAYDCEGDGYPSIPVASAKPERQDVVTLYGYVGVDRHLVHRTGAVLGGTTGMAYMGRPIADMNVIDCPSIPGMSGGPAVNSSGCVVGLVSCSNAFTTACLSWSSIQEALRSAQPVADEVPSPEVAQSHVDQRPVLTVYTTATCGACNRFKRDYAADRAAIDGNYRLIFADPVDGIAVVPTFVTGDRRRTEYTTYESLLEWLNAAPVSPPQHGPDVATAPSGHDQTVAVDDAEPEPTAETHNSTPASNATAHPAVDRDHSGGGFWKVAGGILLAAAPIAIGFSGGAALPIAVRGVAAAGRLVGGLVLRRRSPQPSREVVLHGSGAVLCPPGVHIRDERMANSEPRKEAEQPTPAAPFPRQLDEAGQLLAIGESEGRVAVLDQLRGMCLDDEVQKVIEAGDPAECAAVSKLMNNVSQRVDRIAPLTVKVKV